MPPKGLAPELFGKAKFYIKKVGEDNWQELDGVVKNAISIEPAQPVNEEPHAIAFTCKVNSKYFDLKRMIRERKFVLWVNGRILHPNKPRKTTYKTLRHDCAKRNGRR